MQLLDTYSTNLQETIFIMPGGRDLPYLEKLGDEGAEQIMNFIRMGGTYVGLCAGAYFGASNVVFEPNTLLEVIGERPLKLINGVAYGTLYPEKQFVYGSEAGALVSKVKTADGSSINVYYNGGCAFNISCMDDVEVLGWYEDVAGQPPAILRADHGKGYAVLSGRRCFYLTRWTVYRFSIICLKCA